MRKFIFLTFIACLLMGCSSAAVLKPTEIPPVKAVTQGIPAANCPVTLPEDPVFKAPQPYAANAPWSGIFWYGTEHLWTALQTNGVWSDLPHTEHGYSQKVMWWSSMFVLRDEPEPALIVFGHRLDGEAPPLEVDGATNASAKDIGDAMLTGLNIPTEGCWEITGQYKKTGLTFVVWVEP